MTIVFGVPTLGLVSIDWMTRLFHLRVPPNSTFVQDYVLGEDGIAEKRNRIVHGALERGASHVFFVDDDVLFHSDVLLTLLSRKRPIVSGLYYQKSPLDSPLLWSGPGEGTMTWAPNQLVPCWAHGMGLTLIETAVFRALPAPWFRTLSRAVHGQDVSEDVFFLRRAAEAGYQPLVDTSEAAFAHHRDSATGTIYPAASWQELSKELVHG